MKYKLYRGDSLRLLKKFESDSMDSLLTDPPAGISFMGRDWDSDKGGRDEWIKWMASILRECHRVLKPGAYGLVWALPRTSHWTATACEDAGFKVRDVVTHLFGSGFPKSHNISKAIDKAAGAEREILGTLPAGTGPLKRGHVGSTDGGLSIGTERSPELKITSPATDAAKQWDGWGTALKPASEHWILIQKPTSEKTIAANVLKWGTGAINIDGCRVGPPQNTKTKHASNADAKKTIGAFKEWSGEYATQTQGRFPANLVLSHSIHCTETQCDIECAIAMLDAQSLAGGMHSAGKARVGGVKQSNDGALFGVGNHTGNGTRLGDLGGASRFFYCAKISSGERGEGNTHPTVKPKKLMTYLARLITPPGGTVLDPFMGSGSTGIACKEEEFDFVGIELNKEYFEISKKRFSVQL